MMACNIHSLAFMNHDGLTRLLFSITYFIILTFVIKVSPSLGFYFGFRNNDYYLASYTLAPNINVIYTSVILVIII
jgi:hypothetical protein